MSNDVGAPTDPETTAVTQDLLSSQDITPAVSQKASTSGEVGVPFGRYRLLNKIGSGGMADIFRGVAIGAEGFERLVAIKRIREEVSEVADIGKLFADEARVSALLEHPNIVQVYDFGSVAGTYYIAMEFLKGLNLEEVLRVLRATGERMTPSMAVFIAREVARGLAYAHSFRDERGRAMDIVHRDVSPANIMLMHVGAVKLLDFGIARVTSELRMAITRARSGTFKGKCPYSSPEQITGEPIDGRSDVFALGAVLWETLTGRRLFTGESDLATMSAVINADIPPPSKLVPGLPEALDRIVLTALARDPERRYRSADQLATELETVMQTLPSRHGDLPALLQRLGAGGPVTPRPLKAIAANDTPRTEPDLKENATRQLRVKQVQAAARPELRAQPRLPLSLREKAQAFVAGMVVATIMAMVAFELAPSRPGAVGLPLHSTASRAAAVMPPPPYCTPPPAAALASSPPVGEPMVGPPLPPVTRRRAAHSRTETQTKKVALAGPAHLRRGASRARAARSTTNLHVNPFAE